MAKGQKQLTLFEETPVRYIERNGEPWFTAEEVGRNLGYANPRDDVNRIYQKNKSELTPYSTTAKMAAVDGKSREMRVFNEEGVYLLTILARTDKAREFRVRVARLLRDMRQRRLELARQAGRLEAFNSLAHLSEIQLAILPKVVRYRNMGLSHCEISKLLDVSESTVGRALHRVGGAA